MKYAIFDIETRVDKALVRAVYCPGEAVSDEEAYDRVRRQLAAEQHNDFFPVSFHVPISIAWGHVSEDLTLESVESLGAPAHREGDLIAQFWARAEALDAPLVSFNGRAFDLPVLELNALRHGIAAPRYFNERYGQRYRYSEKHYDLYDFITNAGMYRVRGGLDLLAKLVGLPGKTTVTGSRVQELWETGERATIHRYCQQDVIQTYLLLLRVEQMRGRIDSARLDVLWERAQSWRAQLTA